jgi:hypothetical protein
MRARSSSAAPSRSAAKYEQSRDAGYFISAVEHEISEDMGRVSLINDQLSDYSPMNLFRYSSPGVCDHYRGPFRCRLVVRSPALRNSLAAGHPPLDGNWR